ncbi:MAG: hypothetical protein E6Q66_09880 [Pedobacter sp.]|jgi:DNA-binding CsgD family transcriptional regulator|nr:MAG: hypothetical protein E6Q66_09880 [Pedobacter sp.]
MLWWTRINWVTGTTIAVGLFFVIYLAIKSFKYPDDKNRQRNLLLLCLILIHQVVASYFPDKNINIPILEQHLLLILTNLGFLPFCIFYVKEEIRSIREEESQIRAMDHGLVEKESRIQTLTDALTEKESHIQAMAHDLAQGNIEISRLHHLLETTKAEIARNQKADALSMKKQIAKKNAEILHHRNLLEAIQIEQNNSVQSANQIITEKDAEILQLHQVLEALGKVNTKDTQQRSNSEKMHDDDVLNGKHNKTSFDEECRKHLTKAQTDIIKLVNEGFTYKEVAEMLDNVTTGYIKDTMSDIGKELKVRGKANILRKLNSQFH